MTISLITVTYNSGNTLSTTLCSVLSQTYSDIEYIIVDGLSQDNTVSIIKEYESKFDGRLKWVSEKDSGLYDAMNKGIRMATGDIVGILNSDDFFTRNDILQQVAYEFGKQKELDAVYGDVHFVNPDNLGQCVRYYSSKVFRRNLMRFGFMPAHPSFYLRRGYFEKWGYYKTDYKIAADFEFLLRVIYRGHIRMKYLSLDMVTMRTGGASTAGMASHKQIMREHLRAFRENGIYTNVFLLGLRYVYKMGELLANRAGRLLGCS
ncbi:glycosyltransferase family 2 protein [Phocaeicola sp.]